MVTTTGYNGMPTSMCILRTLIHCLVWGSMADKPHTSQWPSVSVADKTDCVASFKVTKLWMEDKGWVRGERAGQRKRGRQESRRQESIQVKHSIYLSSLAYSHLFELCQVVSCKETEDKQLGPWLALGWVTIQGLDVDVVATNNNCTYALFALSGGPTF